MKKSKYNSHEEACNIIEYMVNMDGSNPMASFHLTTKVIQALMNAYDNGFKEGYTAGIHKLN